MVLRWTVVAGAWVSYLVILFASKGQFQTATYPLGVIPVVLGGILLGWRRATALSISVL